MTDEFAVPDIGDVEVGAVLSALADPVRRRVVLELLQRTADALPGTEFACSSFALPVAKSTRTHHWRVLRDAGLIRQRNLGNGSRVRLRRDEFDAHFPGLLDAVRRASTPAGG